jgi:hypothetical protein
MSRRDSRIAPFAYWTEVAVDTPMQFEHTSVSFFTHPHLAMRLSTAASGSQPACSHMYTCSLHLWRMLHRHVLESMFSFLPLVDGGCGIDGTSG